MDGISSEDEAVLPENCKTPSPQPTTPLNKTLPRPQARARNENKAIQLRFNCPDGFQECSSTNQESRLCLEDIDDNKELWLIRVPTNFDCETLRELNLKSKTTFTRGAKKYQATSKNIKEANVKNGTVALLPTTNGNFSPAPLFTGHVTVMEIPSVPRISVHSSPSPPIVELPSGMRLRYQPYGCDALIKRRVTETENDSPSQPVRKKKKKKKKSHEGRIEVKTEFTAETYSLEGEDNHVEGNSQNKVIESPNYIEIMSKRSDKKKKKHKH